MIRWTDVSPETLLERLKRGDIEAAQIVDVREQWEWDYYHLPGALHIPMNTIPQRLEELSADAEWYILCAHGVRSVAVSRYLVEKGYERVRNISGGIASIALLNGFDYD